MQSGGSFDIDYTVTGPNEKTIMSGSKERQGDFVFTASDAGEYRFCFNNEMSTFAEKKVDFEIAVIIPSLFFILQSLTLLPTGRKRKPRPTPQQARLQP